MGREFRRYVVMGLAFAYGIRLLLRRPAERDPSPVTNSARIVYVPDCAENGLCRGEVATRSTAPMCTRRECFEQADVATPRTSFTGMSKPCWVQQFETNKAAQPSSVVLLGDSIFETLLGTSCGSPTPRALGGPQVLEEKYGKSATVLAISGDQTQHLLWRLPFELSVGERHNASTYVVLIGTNNLGRGHSPKSTVDGVQAVVKWLVDNTNGRVVLLDLLPRNDTATLSHLCPPHCDRRGLPLASFAPAIEATNLRLSSLFAEKNEGSRVEIIRDCHRIFFTQSGSDLKLDTNLMPDSLHPNAEGHRLLADCIFSHSAFLRRRAETAVTE